MSENIDPSFAGEGIYRENIIDHFKNLIHRDSIDSLSIRITLFGYEVFQLLKNNSCVVFSCQKRSPCSKILIIQQLQSIVFDVFPEFHVKDLK